MSIDASPSDEAREFIARMVPDDQPIDFDRIDVLREEYRTEFAQASERAIVRHDLSLSEIVVGGVHCTRVVSNAGGSANGRMLYIFGGAFIVGDPYCDLAVLGALAERCRVEVIAPHYRLAPENQPPAAADDCLTVYSALALEGDERFVVAGESAGGNLALLTTQMAVAQGLTSPAALALLSPAVDLRTDREFFEPTFGIDPSLHPVRMSGVTEAYVGSRDAVDPMLSPLFGSMHGLPPTIITTGSRDLFLSPCLRLERKMRRKGIDVECRVWSGLFHVFEFYDEFPESAESLAEIAAFLNRH
jgi:monoterpene epsilon-lactone hydrolase